MTAPETRAQLLARWRAETPERVRPILESLRRADGGYPEGIAIGPSVQDMANRGSEGRF